MNNHTPGPWIAKGANIVVRDPENKNCLRSLACTYDLSDLEESEANACLMAAAPDLLKVLEIVEPIIDDITASCEPILMVRAAIKKARGETE